VEELEKQWSEWVLAGSPPIDRPRVADQTAPQVAARTLPHADVSPLEKPIATDRSTDRVVIRAQTPSEDPFLISDREKLALKKFRSPTR
jgi:hypothetical protein